MILRCTLWHNLKYRSHQTLSKSEWIFETERSTLTLRKQALSRARNEENGIFVHFVSSFIFTAPSVTCDYPCRKLFDFGVRKRSRDGRQWSSKTCPSKTDLRNQGVDVRIVNTFTIFTRGVVVSWAIFTIIVCSDGNVEVVLEIYTIMRIFCAFTYRFLLSHCWW